MLSKKINYIAASAIMSIALVGCGNESSSVETKEKSVITQESAATSSNADSKSNSSTANYVESRFIEGKHFLKLEQPFFKPKNHVMEVFSFTCPHCFSAEKDLMQSWKSSGDDIQFEILHATYPQWLQEARVYYTLKYLSKQNLNIAFFKARQAKRDFNDKDLNDFVVSNNLDAKEFFQIMNSDQIRNEISKAKKIIDQINIPSVPTFVISGKYVVNLRAISSFSDVKDISEYLISAQP